MSTEPSKLAMPGSFRSRFADAYQVLEDAIAAGAFPGCAFGALACGQVLLEDSLGRFTYDGDSLQVTPQTIYDIASLTKVLATTAVAMLLVQQGRLNLESPLAEYLPGFIVGRPPGTFARYVKLRHLLAHNSGLPGYVEFFRTVQTPAALFRACLELPIEVPPGERAEYSDPGFILLGKALEIAAGAPLESWVLREIFDPLGMRSTGFNPPARLRAGIPPTEEDHTFRNRIIQGEVQDENASVLGGIAGHAGLFSNVADILRFAEVILSPGRANGSPAISIHSLFETDTLTVFSERQQPLGSSRALGWDTPSANSSSGRHFSANSIGHLGYSGCSLWIDPEADVAIVLLTNRTWPDRKNQLIREVRPAFHDAIRLALSEFGNTTLGTREV
jgi:CubicO group peptidase (beta-lactamase class C family)